MAFPALHKIQMRAFLALLNGLCASLKLDLTKAKMALHLSEGISNPACDMIGAQPRLWLVNITKRLRMT